MGKKKCDAAQITLGALRIGLLWAQKGKVFKSRLMQHIHHASHYLRILKPSSKAYVHHGEHEFSFDSTPMIHVKMYRPHSMKFKMPHFPCLQPEVDFQDYKFESGSQSERGDYNNGAIISFFKGGDESDTHSWEVCEDIVPYDGGIDARAEEFITRFYNQIKLQR